MHLLPSRTAPGYARGTIPCRNQCDKQLMEIIWMRAVRELSSVTLSITASCFKNSRTTVRSQITSTKLTFLLIITRHSLVRGISFTVCFFCLFTFFVNDFSTTRGPIQTKFCMRGYSGSGCVFSPFGGWRPPAGGKREKWNFRYYGSQYGFFCILAVFERYLSAWTDPHQILFV